MTKEEIALQLTLRSIDRMATRFSSASTAENNKEFSNHVVDFYNNIYKNLDNTITV